MQLIDMVPECFLRGPELPELLRVLGWELDRVRRDVDDTLAQLRVETATWGLAEIWEPMCGIKTDLTQSLDVRRSQVKTKLQGLGPTTPERIQAIVERWTGHPVTVDEHSSEYWFRVLIEGLLDRPESFERMRTAIAEIKPALMDQVYTFRCKVGESAGHMLGVVQKIQRHKFILEATTT